MDPYNKAISGIKEVQGSVQHAVSSLGVYIIIVLGTIGLIILLVELYSIYKIYQIEKWPIKNEGAAIVNTVIENSTVSNNISLIIASQSYDTKYYRARTSFTYEVDGQIYLSNRLTYNEGWDENPSFVELQKNLLRPGARVDVRINPNDPSEAYLFNFPYTSFNSLSSGLVLSIIGVLAGISLLRNK